MSSSDSTETDFVSNVKTRKLPKLNVTHKPRVGAQHCSPPRNRDGILAIEHVEERRDDNDLVTALRAKQLYNKRIIGYRCKWDDHCDYVSQKRYEVIQHISAKHTDYRPFKCSVCGAPSISLKRMNAHIKAVHKSSSDRFACNYQNCKFSSKVKRNLMRHELTHKVSTVAEAKPFLCDWSECGLRYRRKWSLNEHIRRIHLKELIFCCDWSGCEQRFSRKNRLNNHIRRVHLKEIRFLCDWPGCDAAFTSSDSKTFHTRKEHTNHKPFVCDWPACGDSFYQSNKLSRHKRKHTGSMLKCGETKVMCDWPECGKSFVSQWNYKKHVRIHRGEKPYKCEWPDCERVFTEKGNMVKHLSTHSRERLTRSSVT